MNERFLDEHPRTEWVLQHRPITAFVAVLGLLVYIAVLVTWLAFR